MENIGTGNFNDQIISMGNKHIQTHLDQHLNFIHKVTLTLNLTNLPKHYINASVGFDKNKW